MEMNQAAPMSSLAQQNTTAIELSDVAAGSGGFVIHGETRYDYSGTSVNSAGDINADGLADLIIGAYGADPNGEQSGSSYVVFGTTDNTRPSNSPMSLPAAAALSSMVKPNGTTAADPSAVLVTSTAMASPI